MKNAKKTVCGIDFGTTNTALAVARDQGDVRLVKVEGEEVTIPSTLFFSAHTKSILFGTPATESYISGDEGRYMRSFKRVLGTPLMKEGTIIDGRKISFQDIFARYLEKIKQRAEEYAQTELDEVVAGRPVNFVDDDDAANQQAEDQLRTIYEAIGFKHIRFQYEPIAGAFAHEVNLGTKEHLAMVVDIGGGTSDFTLIRLSGAYTAKADRQDDILANTGIRLGGNDFDRTLGWTCFMPLLGMGSSWGKKNLPFPLAPFADLSEWSKIQWMYTPQYKRKFAELVDQAHDKKRTSRFLKIVESELGHRFMGSVEDAKILLSDQDKVETDLSYIEADLKAYSTQRFFDGGMAVSCSKIEKAIQNCLHMASVKGQDIDLAILTGGGTAIPMIQSVVRQNLPNAALSGDNRLSSVGLGLAYDAKRHFLG